MHICPRIYVSCMKKRPLYMCIHHQVAARENLGPDTHATRYMTSYYYVCVLVLLYMCPHRARRAPVRRPPHTTTCVSSYCCVCPHTTICMSSYYYICVILLLCVSAHDDMCVLILPRYVCE